MILDDSSSFGRRLKYFMDKMKLNSVSMGERIDKTPANVRHWCRDVRFPRSDDLPKIAEILDVTILDLYPNSQRDRARIVNEELKNRPEEYLHLIPNALPPFLKHIPVTKGYPLASEIVEENDMTQVNKIYIDKWIVSKHYQEEPLEAMIVVGDSMSPYLNHGDVAIYYPTQKPKGSAKYVINTPYGLEVKSLTFLTTGDLSMKTENPAFENETVKKEDIDTIEILGLVVGRILKS